MIEVFRVLLNRKRCNHFPFWISIGCFFLNLFFVFVFCFANVKFSGYKQVKYQWKILDFSLLWIWIVLWIVTGMFNLIKILKKWLKQILGTYQRLNFTFNILTDFRVTRDALNTHQFYIKMVIIYRFIQENMRLRILYMCWIVEGLKDITRK